MTGLMKLPMKTFVRVCYYNSFFKKKQQQQQQPIENNMFYLNEVIFKTIAQG